MFGGVLVVLRTVLGRRAGWFRVYLFRIFGLVFIFIFFFIMVIVISRLSRVGTCWDFVVVFFVSSCLFCIYGSFFTFFFYC